MEDQNTQIVREFVEQIFNRKQFDRIGDYCSDQCVFYSPPYVGIGFLPDDSSGVQFVVKSVTPNSPAAGKLHAGDVVLRASDANRVWEGYEQLRTGLFGQGKVGTEVALTVLRDGNILEIPFVRGQVESYKMPLYVELWQSYFQKEMPDFRSEINLILASGDWVAYFATDTGTNTLYHRTAVWTECNFLRLENGKIIEWWGVEDLLSQWRQLGFRIAEPEKEVA